MFYKISVYFFCTVIRTDIRRVHKKLIIIAKYIRNLRFKHFNSMIKIKDLKKNILIYFKIITDSHYLGREDFTLTHNFVWHPMKIKRSKHKLIIIIYRSIHMFEKCFKTTEKGTFKKENKKVEHFDVAGTRKVCRTWLGLGNEVARTPPLGYMYNYVHYMLYRISIFKICRQKDRSYAHFFSTFLWVHSTVQYILQYM